ncbi:MAG: tRNA 5-methoxyuridine(34)/uridine 5-oxyacetic acid(34) synthase CmoB [Woeseiaceae bacterium]
MLDYESLFDDLAGIDLATWRAELRGLLDAKFKDSAHGKLKEWRAVMSDLPAAEKLPADLSGPAISIPRADGVPASRLRDVLLRLVPWRKGPFDLCGVYIDTEWRSDLKWDRIKDSIASLDGRAVLDVGCGNGYFGLRMRGMGAKLVIGIDPTLLYVIQFLAVCHFMRREPVHVLPLRLQELPGDSAVFDTVFSMGVLYHQRSPAAHLEALRSSLRPGGELVLETLILPGGEAIAHEPVDRYARMRNVWLLPTEVMLRAWLADAGFDGVRLIDVSRTTTDEQRTTAWMPFESLAEALDPADTTRTIEGWPAPRRAVLLCNKA